MDKIKTLRYVNILLVISFLAVAASGAIKLLAVFRLIDRAGLPSALINPVHDYGAILFLIASIAHLWLNWNWISFNLLGKKRKQV